MSVAIVSWPINDVGGINSWCKNFISGLTALGVDSHTYHATAQTRYECYEDRELVKKRYSILKGTHLSYRGECLKKSIAELDQHDLVVFLHPSPHPTKANEGPYQRNWQHLYREPRPPKLVVFHDANWEKTNLWFGEVAGYVGAIVAAQKLFIHSVNEYPADVPKMWSYFPLNLELANWFRKELSGRPRQGLVLATQWLKWKNHHKFLPQLHKIMHPISIYGNGQEYHTLKLSGVFQDVISKDHTTGELHKGSPDHQFYGYVPYEQVMRAMAGCIASIDLSTKGYTNMTHWEPLTVGAVSLIERRVATHPDNAIPQDCFFSYDLDNAAFEVNQVLHRDNAAKRALVIQRANKFIAQSGHVRVTKRILDWLAENHVVRILK